MQIYQLVVNRYRDLYAVATIEDNVEMIKIFSGKFQEIYSKEFTDIIYLEFISDKLLIQTYKYVYIINFRDNRVERKFKLNKKISNVLIYDNNFFVYASRDEFEILKVNKVILYGEIKEVIIAQVQLFENFKIEYNIIEYESEIRKLVKKYRIENREITDKIGINEVKVIFDYLNSKIILNDNIIFLENGYIDRIYILSDGNIIYSISSFLFPTKLIYYDLFKNEREEYNSYFEKKNISIKHSYITKREIPIYTISQKNSRKILLYLHGGPAWNITPNYYGWIEETLELGYSIVFMNYSGSTGYGEKFYKKLLKNNGEEALKDIKEFVNYFNNRNIYILGESYGGYLAVLMSFYKNKNIKLCISINGFVDYKYLYLFSHSRNIIESYFDVKSDKNNPIHILEKNKIYSNLIFLHSDKDIYAPIKNIYTFIEKTKKHISLYLLTEIGHYSISHYKNKQRDVIINKLIGGEYNE